MKLKSSIMKLKTSEKPVKKRIHVRVGKNGCRTCDSNGD
jgi:hypothetical protein